jgi:hypothetical protein
MVKCARCKKEKEEDGFKCCPECREQQKKISREKHARKKADKEQHFKEIEFQQKLRKKDELEAQRKKELSERKWSIDRFLVPNIHPFTDKKCPILRRLILQHKVLLKSLSEHYSTCGSCQDWKYEFDNHTLTDEQGNFYQGTREELDFPLGEDAETCRKFRDRYSNPDNRNEFYAFLEDTHLPNCEFCKAWKSAFDENRQDENWKETDYSKMGENKSGWNDITNQNDPDIYQKLHPETPEEKTKKHNPLDESIRQQQELYQQEQSLPSQSEPSQSVEQPQPKQESYIQQLLRQFQNRKENQNQG